MLHSLGFEGRQICWPNTDAPSGTFIDVALSESAWGSPLLCILTTDYISNTGFPYLNQLPFISLHYKDTSPLFTVQAHYDT